MSELRLEKSVHLQLELGHQFEGRLGLRSSHWRGTVRGEGAGCHVHGGLFPAVKT